MILAFYLVHLFRLYRVLTCISWPLSELLHYLIGTLLLLIASIVAASKSYSQSELVAASIFGFVATFLCLASVWLSYKISCVTQSTDLLEPQATMTDYTADWGLSQPKLLHFFWDSECFEDFLGL
ncbi:CKLF-like MARVEL transmembrane domain-containing protein 7 [Myotis brandtii]|uniref:CKLF-like MARVEL transmembrane domain-containing protein 7 n=1 Tax=Myotis brandtii TaxID=109478 RepID=S7Q0Z4_MYOBR|nr:CKLF-like MARVEL transmembrane domain-containing protein 7 [Myotis brandtii]